jgi:hypothetical protein
MDIIIILYIMFLIIGNSNCLDCEKAKMALSDDGQPYLYQEAVPNIRDKLQSIDNNLKLPYIFKLKGESCTPITEWIDLDQWSYIGKFIDLLNLLDDI